MNKKETERAIEECCILQQLSHPNIVEYKDFYDEEDYMCLVLEFMDTDLYNYVNYYFDELTENDIKDIFEIIVNAVDHCH